ncbi:MAG TPA: hypothetical protein V6D23_27335 [Candidatus Obscuribacterales bacterium]
MSPEAKLQLLTPHLSIAAHARLLQVLAGTPLTREETYLSQIAAECADWLEARLASEHLGYLAKDQANGVWGQSTTQALALVAQTYGLPFDGSLNQALLAAVLDGQKSPRTRPSAPNSYEWLKQGVQATGAKWDEQAGHINLIGIRGYLLPVGQVDNLPDIYNDTLFQAWVDSLGKERVQAFVASTDPGRYYYRYHKLNPRGCAWLKPGQYCYQRGMHRTYPALVQASDVTVYRIDASGQAKTGDYQQTGQFGIHIHAGTGGPDVYNASAGCQVIQSQGPQGWQWQKFWQRISQAANHLFLYTLLEEL